MTGSGSAHAMCAPAPSAGTEWLNTTIRLFRRRVTKGKVVLLSESAMIRAPDSLGLVRSSGCYSTCSTVIPQPRLLYKLIDVNRIVSLKTHILTMEQCRGARAMLGWSQDDLAREANVARQTVADFERGARMPIANNLASMATALEAAGIELLVDNGLRLRPR
ncbi:multiprotein-bridging factor 1 family protein [Rhizobiaceae sp. 2RAB30]